MSMTPGSFTIIILPILFIIVKWFITLDTGIFVQSSIVVDGYTFLLIQLLKESLL